MEEGILLKEILEEEGKEEKDLQEMILQRLHHQKLQKIFETILIKELLQALTMSQVFPI